MDDEALGFAKISEAEELRAQAMVMDYGRNVGWRTILRAILHRTTEQDDMPLDMEHAKETIDVQVGRLAKGRQILELHQE